jgi:hypothetical protein
MQVARCRYAAISSPTQILSPQVTHDVSRQARNGRLGNDAVFRSK